VTGHTSRSSLVELANHWGVVLGYGLFTLVVGLAIAFWPRETITVIAVLIGIQLLVGGVLRIVLAVAGPPLDTAAKVFLGLTGGVALIVGLLCLRDPMQTLLAIAWLVGAWWVLSGVVDVIRALLPTTGARRAWELAGGLVSVVAGGVLISYPQLSLKVITVILCISLLVTGAIAIVSAFRMRSLARSTAPDHTSTSGSPAAPSASGG
jgi:uncharacterized membrane protein HdeD (DUF308 family)